MEMPLVSVIVPVYKVEPYLHRCVDSILSQTYTHLEIFLVDDGSPDNCGKICDEYAKKDSRIKVIHKHNSGQSDARNTGIDNMTGEWVVFVDSDDMLMTDYVETLLNLAMKNNCKVGVSSWITSFDIDCITVNQPVYKEMVFNNMEGVERMFYQNLFDTAPWAKIYHRSLFDLGIRFPSGLIYEDLGTIYLLLLHSDKIAFCNRITYNYLLRKNSTEGQPFKPHKLDSGLKIIKMIQSHANELKPIEKAVRCRLLSFCLHILLEMPAGYPDKRKQVLIDYVKRNRWRVLTDARARKKARIGALISYLGLNTVRNVLNQVKERNK